MPSKGGSAKQITGYRYTMAVHFGLCRGPVNELTEIRVGDLSLGTASITTTSSFGIDRANLFGGDEKEGGIKGTLKLFMGAADQVIDSVVKDNIEGGFPVPGWRGVATAFYYGQISSNNPYPKTWKFRVNRTTAGWDTDVWEPDLAQINVASSPVVLLTFNSNPKSGNTIRIGEVNVGFFTLVDPGDPINVQIGADTAATAAAFIALCNAKSENLYDVTATGSGTTVTLQFPDAVAVASEGFDFLSFITGTVGNFVTIANQGGGIKAMNPAHILYEVATNNVWGRGFPVSFIDEVSFKNAAQQLMAESFGLCIRWNRQEDIDRFVKMVVDHIGAAVYIHRQTGLLTLKLIRNDYNPNELPAFSFENGLLDIIEDESSATDTSFNEVIVTYIDPVTGSKGTLRVQNLASFQSLGTLISTSVDYPGIPTARLAARVAQRDLQINSSDIRRFKIKMDRVGWFISPGDVFKISVPSRGIQSMILRAGEIEDGPLEDGTITITAMQDVFGLPETSFVALQPSFWTPLVKTARVIDQRYVDEMTHYDLSENLPPAELSGVTADTGVIKIYAEQPSGYTIDYLVMSKTSTEAAFVQRSVAGFDAGADLLSSLTTAGTATMVGSVSSSSLITGADIPVLLQSADDPEVQEYCRLETINSTTGAITISRGCIDTIPHEFAIGDKVWFQTHAPTSDFRDYATTELVSIKLLSRTTSDVLGIDDADEDVVEIGGRQGRPYPPGDFKINGQPFGSVSAHIGADDIVFTWAHRDRITQANFLVDHSEASTGPEVGTTYRFRVYDSLDFLLRTQDAIAGTTWTYTNAMWVTDGSLSPIRFELESVRDDLPSWQMYNVTISAAVALVSPELFEDDDTFYAPTLAAVGRTSLPGLFTDFDFIYLPSVLKDTIAPSLLTDADAIYQPAVAGGPVVLLPGLLTDIDDVIHVPLVIYTPYLYPSLFTDADTFYTPIVTVDQELLPGLFTDTDTFHVPNITEEDDAVVGGGPIGGGPI